MRVSGRQVASGCGATEAYLITSAWIGEFVSMQPICSLHASSCTCTRFVLTACVHLTISYLMMVVGTHGQSTRTSCIHHTQQSRIFRDNCHESSTNLGQDGSEYLEVRRSCKNHVTPHLRQACSSERRREPWHSYLQLLPLSV